MVQHEKWGYKKTALIFSQHNPLVLLIFIARSIERNKNAIMSNAAYSIPVCPTDPQEDSTPVCPTDPQEDIQDPPDM